MKRHILFGLIGAIGGLQLLVSAGFPGPMKLLAADSASLEGAATRPAGPPADPSPSSDPAARPAGWSKNWPQFRGPSGDGEAGGDADPPAEFDLAKDTRFNTPLPAGGRSSPIIWNDRVYLTGDDGCVMALDRVTGKVLWNTKLEAPPAPREADPDEPGPGSAGASTSPATPTPVTDGRFVYAFFGSGALGCVDARGKQVWARQLVNGGPRNMYGLAASPILYGDLLIQLIDRGTNARTKRSFLAAVRTKDGTEVWRTDRAVTSCWTTPVIVRGPAGDVLVTNSPQLVIAYDPKTGRQLWQAQGSSKEELATSPVACGAGTVLLEASEGFSALQADGKGDVTKSGVAWISDVASSNVSSPIGAGQRCYLFAEGGLTCIDGASGKMKWSLDLDGDFWASPALAKDRIYAISRDGTLFVVSTEGKKLSEVRVGGKVDASPAIVDGCIYIRTSDHLLCLGHRK